MGIDKKRLDREAVYIAGRGMPVSFQGRRVFKGRVHGTGEIGVWGNAFSNAMHRLGPPFTRRCLLDKSQIATGAVPQKCGLEHYLFVATP